MALLIAHNHNITCHDTIPTTITTNNNNNMSFSKKRPKLAVLSQAHSTSTSPANNNNNNNNNNNSITVVVCPKSTTSIIRLTETEKQHEFPYWERLSKNYGFSIEVEIVLMSSDQQQRDYSLKKSGGNNNGGPKRSHFLLSNAAIAAGNAITTAATTTHDVKLHHYSERLIIRPVGSSSSSNKKKKSDQSSLLRPDFENGDVITSIDGMTNPTFGMIYAVMMRGDKLLLEIERRRATSNNKSSRGQADSNASSTADDVTVARQDVIIATTEDAASKKKRQVSAWDAENRRVQREQLKLQQREQEKERVRLQQVEEESGATTTTAAAASSNTTTAAAASSNTTSKKQKQSKATKSTNNNTITLNVHSPNYISKAVARLEQNVDEFNRQQRHEEEAMYGKGNRMLLDYTLADDGNNGHDEKKKSVDDDVHNDDDEKMASIPIVDLTFDTNVNVDGDSVGGDNVDNIGDDSFSIVNSLDSFDHPPPLAPASPIQSLIGASGNNDSSSSSSDSSSSSSSGSSSSSSSSSSSDSDSSLSNDKFNSTKSIQPPQTITATSTGVTNKSISTPPRNSNNERVTYSRPATAAPAEHLSTKRPRSSSSLSNDGAGGKTYPTYSSTMNYPVRTTTKSGLNEAPTSLSRLWPDPSDIVKALTKWQPPSATVKQRRVEFYGAVGNSSGDKGGGGTDKGSSSNPLLVDTKATNTTSKQQSNEFKNANEMMECLARPLMDEGLASINNEYHSTKLRNGRWNRDTHRLIVVKVTPVTPIFEKKSSFFGEHIKMYEIQFSLKGETRIPPSNLSELYCLHYHRWKGCRVGIVGHDFPTTITFRSQSESNSILKLFVCVDGNLTDDAAAEVGSKTGWLSKHDFRALFDPHKFGVPHPNAVLTLMSVGSTTNIVRQFEAIASIGHLKPHIQKALFSSCIQTQQKPAAATVAARPRSLPTDIWSSLQNNHNQYQLSSISKVVSGSCKNNVCLIQGPPGTGKSSTIVGIVSALLSGKAPLPGQRQSGCLIHPGKTMGVSHSERQARNRILVCAATNIAVDTIAWKIKQGSIGPSGKVGDFKMSRFGSLPWDHVRDDGRDSVKVQKPQTLTEMEQFLYAINADRRASDGIQSHFHNDFDDEEEDNYKCWSPEGKKAPQRRKRRKRIVGRGAKRKEIIAESSIVVTTLSGAGSKAFIDAACRDPTRNDCEFDAVIIDEACVASESETLIPLKFNPTTVTLVGDPRQLPVLSLATNQSKKSLYERSLFERMQNLQWPTMLLRQQYRMHERIAIFPSKQFYEGKLITSKSVKNRLPSPWENDSFFPTICFWDTKRVGPSGGGVQDFTNTDESDFIFRRIMAPFIRKYSGVSFADDPNNNLISIGIISFYKDQVKSLQQQWNNTPAFKAAKLTVKIATVDGFQGSECDIIILSCVRSRNMNGRKTSSIGFLSDERRMNVALTRAKRSLWVVGDSDVLKANHVWKRLIDHVEREGILRHGGNHDVQLQGNGSHLDGRWIVPAKDNGFKAR